MVSLHLGIWKSATVQLWQFVHANVHYLMYIGFVIFTVLLSKHMYEEQLDYEEKMVIQNQTILMQTLQLMKCEVSKLTDQYVSNITEYCELKDIDDSYMKTLTVHQRNRMYLLKEYLGLGENYEIPNVKEAINIVKEVSKQVSENLQSELIKLDNALGENEPDIKKMKQLQNDLNITTHYTFFKEQFESIVSRIIMSPSHGHELQAGGVLHQITKVFGSHVMPVILKIAASVVHNMVRL